MLAAHHLVQKLPAVSPDKTLHQSFLHQFRYDAVYCAFPGNRCNLRFLLQFSAQLFDGKRFLAVCLHICQNDSLLFRLITGHLSSSKYENYSHIIVPSGQMSRGKFPIRSSQPPTPSVWPGHQKKKSSCSPSFSVVFCQIPDFAHRSLTQHRSQYGFVRAVHISLP